MASSNQGEAGRGACAASSWNSSSLPPKGPHAAAAAPGALDSSPPFAVPSQWMNHQQLQCSSTSLLVPTPQGAGGQQQQQLSSWLHDTPGSSADTMTSRRALHRRSASDTAAFLDDHHHPAAVGGYRSSLCFQQLPSSRTASSELERLGADEEQQIMSMLAEGQQIHSRSGNGGGDHCQTAAASSPSESNSGNDMTSIEDGKQSCCPKSEAEEVQSVRSVPNSAKQPTASTHIDPSMDPKRAKRILANRQSAQRSRLRKLQYIAELERSVTALQTEVSALTPQVAFLDHQRLLLNVDNNTIKQRIASLLQDKSFKDAHNDALSREVHRLRQMLQQQEQLSSQLEHAQYHQQSQAKTEVSSPLASYDALIEARAEC